MNMKRRTWIALGSAMLMTSAFAASRDDVHAAMSYDGLRQISEALETPICAGETFHQALEFRSLLDRRGVDVVMIDLEVGGITQWLKMAHLVEAYRVPVTNHVTTEVSAHVISAVTGLTAACTPWAEPIFKEGLSVQDGRLVLFERPGLGLELDFTALKKFAV